MDQASTHGDTAFFEQWAIYQSVIANNYMFHAEIIDILRQQLGDSDKPLSVLDLGCGDAYVISKSLSPQRKLRYCGVDMSGGALDFARQNLAGFQGSVSLIQNDFLRELEQITDTFDVIVCGYTLHHLPREDKQRFLQRVRQRLAEDGLFIFYDVETNDAETRNAYLQRACQTMQQSWSKISSERMDSVVAHVQNNDLPESPAFHQQAFRDSGFNDVEKPFRDPHGLFSLYLLRADAARGRNTSQPHLIRGGNSITVPWQGKGWEWKQV